MKMKNDQFKENLLLLYFLIYFFYSRFFLI